MIDVPQQSSGVSTGTSRKRQSEIASPEQTNRRQSLDTLARQGEAKSRKVSIASRPNSALLALPIPAAVRRNSNATVSSVEPSSRKCSQPKELVEAQPRIIPKSSTQDLVSFSSPKRTASRKKKDHNASENIFTKFGEENGPTDAKHSVVEGGVQKGVNIRKHWNSDVDIQRWRQALTDSSRFDKLLTDVRHRWHPDFGSDRAQLVQKHNGLYRQRDDYERKDSAKTAAAELRELQMKILPKAKAKAPKKIQITFEGLSLFGKDRASPVESEFVSPMMQMTRSLSFDSVASSHHSEQEHASLLKEEDNMLPASLEATPSGSLGGVVHNTTPTNVSQSCPSSDERRSKRSSAESKVKFPKTQLPRTFALFLYRNGERTQKCGETVFFHREPKDMKEVLRLCGERCKPLIAPVEALLDTSLRPAKDVHEVQKGGIFLLKGQEALNPPASFLQRGEPLGGSMRHLSQFQRHNNSSPSLFPRAASKLDVPQDSRAIAKPQVAKSISAVHLPFVGRSETSSVQREDPVRVTWTVDDRVAWRLSYGGLVNNVKHHDYSLWPPILPVSSRSDRVTNISGESNT